MELALLPSWYLELKTKSSSGLGRGECGKSWGLGALGSAECRVWLSERGLRPPWGGRMLLEALGGATGALVLERSNAEASPPLRQMGKVGRSTEELVGS